MEFNLGETVRLKMPPKAIGAKYDGRIGIIVKKIQMCDDIYAYGVHVNGIAVDVYKPFTNEVVGKTSILDGLAAVDMKRIDRKDEKESLLPDTEEAD